MVIPGLTAEAGSLILDPFGEGAGIEISAASGQ